MIRDLGAWRKVARGDLESVPAALAQVQGETPLAEVEKVAICGDWHGDWQWVQRIVSKGAAQGVQTLVVLGDFGLWPGGDDYLDHLSRLAQRLGVTVVWLDGNHEDFDQLERYPVLDGLRPIRPRVWHLPRGTRWTWGGETWLAVGGATSLDRAVRTPGQSWWPQEQLTDAEVQEVGAAGHADVLLTHDCPSMVVHDFGIPPSFWALEDLALADVHRERVQRLVERVTPKQLYHGHLHRAYQRHLQAAWGEMVVTGLDCNGSRHGHTLVLAPGGHEGAALLELEE